jgi:hypothetical protein
MSRSQPTLTNPALHFFEWKGGDGKLEFYDKEKQQRITVPLPFEFLPLDQLATVTGYSKMAKSSYYSNEVRNTAKEEFTVKLKGQTVFTGMYKNNQGIAQLPKGASYTKSIYIAHKTKTGEYIIGNIKASGSALGAWIEFNSTCKPENGKVVMTKGDVQESPVGQFYPPKFTYESVNAEENDSAIELDKQLQIYLSHYLSAPKFTDALEESQEDAGIDQSVGLATEEQILDFEQRKAAKLDISSDPMDAVHAANPLKTDTVYEDAGEEINLDEIPF